MFFQSPKTMKAKELLQLYQAGERDFRGVNLQGQSFLNQDLFGVDLSGADIRGADFSQAKLTGANFQNAKAGLQPHSALFLTTILCLLIVIYILCCVFIGYLVSLIVHDYNSTYPTFFAFYISSLFALFVTSLCVGFKKGLYNHYGVIFGLSAYLTFALFLPFILSKLDHIGIAFPAILLLSIQLLASLFSIIFIIALSSLIYISYAFFGSTIILVIYFGAAVFSSFFIIGKNNKFLATVLATITIALLLASGTKIINGISVALESANYDRLFLLIVTIIVFVSSIMLLASTHICSQILANREKFVPVRAIAIAFSAIGGTSFRKATLSATNFDQAQVQNTDFRKASLMHSNLNNARNLNLARPSIDNSINIYRESLDLWHFFIKKLIQQMPIGLPSDRVKK
ncbi:pentapeptide repeat-containing protein [Acaryochloris marina NIES-2412]|uniref:pentapeptide repeat-containing protein n=1 Tax=Acaryochloris marina TaxID=155978 RepID=UPI0040598D11